MLPLVAVLAIEHDASSQRVGEYTTLLSLSGMRVLSGIKVLYAVCCKVCLAGACWVHCAGVSMRGAGSLLNC